MHPAGPALQERRRRLVGPEEDAAADAHERRARRRAAEEHRRTLRGDGVAGNLCSRASQPETETIQISQTSTLVEH